MQKSKMQLKIQSYLEQKAQKYADKIIKLPFVRAVCLTGSVAAGKATEKSDIDYFIQIENGRLYIGRLIATVIVHLLGQRRTNSSITGKLCLNWFGISNLPKQRHYPHQILAVKSTLGRDRALWRLRWGKWAWGRILDAAEATAKRYQVYRIKKDHRTHAKGSQVRWTNDELGFHPSKE